MCPPPLLAYPKPLQLSSSPTASAAHKPKDVPPFPPPLTPQPSQPCPRETSSLQSSPQTFSGEVLPTHPTSLQCLLGKSYTRKGQRQDGISLHALVPMSSPPFLLPLCFPSSSSCLWTAACLINDNIGAFPLLLYSIIFALFIIFTLVHSLYVQSICNYLLLISPKSSTRAVNMSALAAPLSRWTSQYREDKSYQQEPQHLSVQHEVFWSEQLRNRSPQFTVPFIWKKSLQVPIQWVTLGALSHVQWAKMI